MSGNRCMIAAVLIGAGALFASATPSLAFGDAARSAVQSAVIDARDHAAQRLNTNRSKGRHANRSKCTPASPWRCPG